MMDLADLRKKARAEKLGEPDIGSSDAQAAARERSSVSVQGEPLEFDLGAMESPSSKPAVPAGLDPLETLFKGDQGLKLATEESFLTGLSGSSEQLEKKRQWLTFSLGKEEYALDIESIHEIIKPREITDIPRVPQFVMGIISLRGIIVPVYDLTLRLKLGTAELSPSSRIIVCQQGDRTAGLLVDSINQVVRIGDDAIEPPPSMLTGPERELVRGVGRQKGRMMILLNLQNVLDPELI